MSLSMIREDGHERRSVCLWIFLALDVCATADIRPVLDGLEHRVVILGGRQTDLLETISAGEVEIRAVQVRWNDARCPMSVSCDDGTDATPGRWRIRDDVVK
jgi:hypothetical protein